MDISDEAADFDIDELAPPCETSKYEEKLSEAVDREETAEPEEVMVGASKLDEELDRPKEFMEGCTYELEDEYCKLSVDEVS